MPTAGHAHHNESAKIDYADHHFGVDYRALRPRRSRLSLVKYSFKN